MTVTIRDPHCFYAGRQAEVLRTTTLAGVVLYTVRIAGTYVERVIRAEHVEVL